MQETINRKIEKQHTCVGCGCIFRYKVDRSDFGATMFSAMSAKDKDVVAYHPCPTCGLIQPEMVMWSKVWLPFLMLGSLAAIIIVGLGTTVRGGPSLLFAHVGVGLFVVLGLAHLMVMLQNPNADLEANRKLAEKEVEKGKLQLYSAGCTDEPVRAPRNVSFAHWLAIPFLIAGPIGFFYPIMNQTKDTPAPHKNAGLDPEIVAPGDEVSFKMKSSRLEAINGSMWRGTVTVRVQNATTLGIPEVLEATGNTTDWGESFKVSSGSSNKPLSPTIRFKIPKSESLNGKTLLLGITVNASFPVMTKGGWGFKHTFVNQSGTLSETLKVKLSDTAQVEEARKPYLLSLAGGGLFFLGSLWLTILASTLQLRKSESHVVNGQEPEPSTDYPATIPMRPAAAGDWRCPPAASYRDTEDVDLSRWGDRRLPGR